MNAILKNLSQYVLLKQNWDTIQLKMEVRNQLEAIQMLTKSFEKGVFEDGSKNKLSVITPDIFNERIMCCVIEHVLCKFDVPIPRNTIYPLVKKLQNIPKKIAEMILQREDPEDILLEYSSVQQRDSSKGLMVDCSEHRINFVLVNLKTCDYMDWHDIEEDDIAGWWSSRTLLQPLKSWHSILNAHAWQACKFKEDMRAVACDNDLSLSVYQRHIHDYLRYVFVVDGTYCSKKAFLVIDVSELEVISFLMPHKEFWWHRSNILGSGAFGRRGGGTNNVWSPNFIEDHEETEFYIVHYMENCEYIIGEQECWWPGGIGKSSSSTEEAFYLHEKIIRVCERLFANLARDPDTLYSYKECYSSDDE